MPFCGKTLDLLVENRFRDSRDWYREHREELRRYVTLPMLELAEQLAPVVEELDPLAVSEPRRALSRIWRDTRFTRDKTLFREVMWIAFSRDREAFPHAPSLFFEFSPQGWRYGCGWWQTPPPIMEALRKLVQAEDSAWLEACRALEQAPLPVQVEGARYKRPRFEGYSPSQRLWLEQRTISFLCASDDFDCLFSSRLHETVSEGFRALAPVYLCLCKAQQTA